MESFHFSNIPPFQFYGLLKKKRPKGAIQSHLLRGWIFTVTNFNPQIGIIQPLVVQVIPQPVTSGKI